MKGISIKVETILVVRCKHQHLALKYNIHVHKREEFQW